MPPLVMDLPNEQYSELYLVSRSSVPVFEPLRFPHKSSMSAMDPYGISQLDSNRGVKTRYCHISVRNIGHSTLMILGHL